jgi:hypothetical protein
MRFTFLGLFAVLAYTTAMMYQPEQVGYSKTDRDGLAKLVERVTAKPGSRPLRHMTLAARAAVLADVYGISPGEVTKPIKLWGPR